MKRAAVVVGPVVAALVVVLLPSAAAAAPVVGAVAPVAMAVVGDAVVVSTTATDPTYLVTSVTAQIGAATMPMTGTGATRSATLSLGGQPFGPLTLTVTAENAVGETTRVTHTVRHDLPPALAVATVARTVARPTLRLAATCSDADVYPCASLTVLLGGTSTVLASVTGAGPTLALDQTVSLAAYEGREISLTFRAEDAAGARTDVVRSVVVESSDKLVVVDELPGPVLDVDATRILFVDASGNVATKDRATSAVVTHGPLAAGTSFAPGAFRRAGRLTSAGAVYRGGERRNGVLSARPELSAFVVEGDWVVWITPPDEEASSHALQRENVATGAIETLASGSGLLPAHFCVDSAGNAAYVRFDVPASAYQLRRVDPAGTQTLLALGVDPLIDGDLVAYRPHQLSPSRRQMYLSTPSGIETLDGASSSAFPAAGSLTDYRMGGGFVGFTKIVSGERTAWTRSSTGIVALASPLVGVRRVAGVNAAGQVVHDVTDPVAWKRYVASAGPTAPTTPLAIGGANGVMVDVGGVWHELVGRTVFRVDPDGAPPVADAGVEDGDDAGTSSSSSSGASGGASSRSNSGSTSSSSGATSASSRGGASSDDGASRGGSSSGGDGGCSATDRGDESPAAPVATVGLLTVAAAVAARRRRSRQP